VDRGTNWRTENGQAVHPFNRAEVFGLRYTEATIPFRTQIAKSGVTKVTADSGLAPAQPLRQQPFEAASEAT
jgi:hypothetical protein